MNLETLNLFCQVVRRQSFSIGASDCGVTQSAASQAIRQLEEQLDVQLLDRSRRPLEATVEGEKFYAACRDLLDAFERARAELSRGKRTIRGTVRVAAIYSVGLHDMGGHLQRYRQLYPDARVRLECLHPEEVVTSVLEDTADVGILSYAPALRTLAVVPLKNEPMRLVCHPAHPLAQGGSVRLADLAGQPFVAFDTDLSIRKAVDRAFRTEGVRAEVVMEFDNVESIKQAVFLEPWVSILPESAVSKEAAMKSLAVLPIEEADLFRPVSLIHRRGRPQSPAVARFIEMVREGEPQPATA